MKEDGMNNAARNFGRFFLFMIPWAVGVAAVVWLGVFITLHNFKQQIKQEHKAETQEQRAAAYSGAAERPTAQIKIEIVRNDCSTISRVDVDGDRLVMYGKNTCHKKLSYFAYHWQLLSPNGLVLRESYDNNATCPMPSFANDEAECQSRDFKMDDRAVRLRVWSEVNSY